MPRPRRYRHIRGQPATTAFKPLGIPLQTIDNVALSLEEFEAVRLLDKEHLTQEAAAQLMQISQATLSRTITKARTKIAEALTEGKAIIIATTNHEPTTPKP